MVQFIELKGYAKVNLSLGIHGNTRDGYHNLDTVMVEVNLYDEVKVFKREDRVINLTYVNGESYLNDNALNAAIAIQKRYNLLGADIEIKKNVPSGVGLGGSAVDAAVIVKAYEALYGISVNDLDFLLSLGADVPFLKVGGAHVITGRGEVKEKVDLKTPYMLLVYGKERLNTAEVFALYDVIGGDNGTSKEFVSTLKPFNALERAAQQLEPSILKNRQVLLDASFSSVVMTGSGTGFIGIEWNEAEFNEKVEKAIELATKNNLTTIVLTTVKE